MDIKLSVLSSTDMYTGPCLLCFQAKLMQHKDRRIRLMNEVLKGIKVIKLYAWEEHFQRNVQSIRRKELIILTIIAFLNAISSFTQRCAPFLVKLT